MYRKVYIFVFLSLMVFDSTVDDAVNNGVEWLCLQQNADSTWGNDPLKFLITSTVLKAFIHTGKRDSEYVWGLEKFYREALPSVDHLARYMEILVPLEGDTSGLIDTLISFQNIDGGFGIYHFYESDPLDASLVFNTFSAIRYSDYNRIGRLVTYLVNSQKDSCWAYGDSVSSIMLTALCTYALEKYQNIFNTEEFINKAIAWMMKRQNLDGGFGYDSSTVYETGPWELLSHGSQQNVL